ncbi:putative Ral GTPase-activating protein subunit alpha-2 [Blattamonas nauphoetae]|uniref:Ral GTPase-activating protein subunit alpha-2 n=1 Tax=Blattamonas nauphoetae TaxID=2049346 RepID=A0ABQ9XP02_9EUKA|nr:putative Ral GTPase-activating protein subunit alpha-2 [Blattamonas nauphoetae]
MIDKEAVTHLSEAELVSADDSKEQTILVLRVLHLLRDNNFQYVAPCLITWESVFRYALRLDVTDITNPVVKLNLRFGDICPLFKKAYEQDTTPIDDSPPPPLAPRFEDMESEDGHFDTSKIEQSVKTAMGNADVGAYTSLSSYSPTILGGIFYTPNIGHLIKPEKMIIKEKNLVKVVICGGHPVKQPHPMTHILVNFGTGTELYVPISSTLPNKHEVPCIFMQMPPHHDTLLLTSSVHCRRLSEVNPVEGDVSQLCGVDSVGEFEGVESGDGRGERGEGGEEREPVLRERERGGESDETGRCSASASQSEIAGGAERVVGNGERGVDASETSEEEREAKSMSTNLTKHVFIPPPPHTFTPPIPPHTSATPRRKGFFPQTYSYNTSNRLFWSHFGGTSTDKRTCGVLFAPPGEDESMSKFLMRPNILAFNRNLETNTLNPLPQSSQLVQDFSRLNESPERSQHKIGVIYVRNGQVEQNAILTNETSSPFFVSFIKSLGWEVDLATQKGFMGGLDRTGIAGVTSPYYSDYANEVIFHVPSFWMSRPDDPQQSHKKRHMGNDHVHIIWNEHTQEYKPNTISSQFIFAHVVVNAIPSSGNRLFRVRVFAKKLQQSVGDKLSGPLIDNAVVSIRTLPELLRQTVMNANRSARIMQNLFLRPYAQREESISNLLKHTANTSGLTSELQQFIPSSHSVM